MATQQKFCQYNNVRRSPSSKSIKSIVVKLKTNGSGLSQQKGTFGRPKRCRTVKNIETVRLSVIADPKKSHRKLAQALNMKPTSLLTVLRKNFQLILYACHTLQQLSNFDKPEKLVRCQWFRQEIENYDWIKNVWLTDEALLFK